MNKEIPLKNPGQVVSIYAGKLGSLDHEEVWCLFLNSINNVISFDMLSKGTLTETAIDCRTIIRQTLLHNASSIILIHNHPSGNPTPSQPDCRFTSRLSSACSLMDINLVDHIIIADDSFYSFSEERLESIS